MAACNRNLRWMSAALGVLAALMASGAGAWLAGLGSWPAGLALAAVAFALAGGSLWLLWRWDDRAWLAASRHFEALARLDPEDLHGDRIPTEIQSLPAAHPLAAMAALCHQMVLNHGQFLDDLRQRSTSLEVRCRRAAADSQRISAIFAELAEPILAIDQYEEVVAANRAAEELFQIESHGAEGRSLSQLVRCEKLLALLTGTARRKTSGSRSEEIELSDPQGQSRWFRATAVKLGSDGGQSQFSLGENGTIPFAPAQASLPTDSAVSGAAVVLRGVGDQKALQKRNAEFVSAVSHEMKTPLAGIKAYVELLADGDAEDQATRDEFLQIIDGQADRLQRLVENLLNIARIEAGVVRVNKQSSSLNELLEEALRVVRPSAEAKPIDLVAELSPMYLGVLADRDMLLQAAINLLSNAVKYTAGGGRVTLRSRSIDSQVRFEVEDTGVGLSEEDRQRVFEKFYRVEKDKKMASGTGLGLSLAKHIVEDVHGGQITVESTLGKGSTFAVTMPVAGCAISDL